MRKKKMSWEEKDKLLAEVYGNPPDFLESLGYTPEILEAMKPTPATEAVECMFFERAKNALAEAGYSALEFLAANPGVSTIELAKRLNRSVNAIGLKNAIYEEAIEKEAVRETAKDLLIRKILRAFPDGWSSSGKLDPDIKIRWSHEFLDYVSDPELFRYAVKIQSHLTKDNPPPEGWKPQPENDPLIDELFDRYWPADAEYVADIPDTVTPQEEPAAQPGPSWFDRKSTLMEAALGKEHDKVMHALLPYAMGGTLDLYFYPHGLPGTAIATRELSESPDQGSSNDIYRVYELVMFTRHRIHLDAADDPTTPFGHAYSSINTILNAVARESAVAKLNPNETCEIPSDEEGRGGKCIILDAYTEYPKSGPADFGLLLVIEIFRSEMDFARNHGGARLIQRLKEAGHYPCSDLDREPVA